MKETSTGDHPTFFSLLTGPFIRFFERLARLRRLTRGKIMQMLKHKLTIMIVPHNGLGRFNLQFTFSFAFFATAFSIGMFSWATITVMSNIDYWTMKANHEIMKLKVDYFAKEMRKSREILEHVKEADIQLRKLLRMKNRRAIIEGYVPREGEGGPELFEQSILQKTLDDRLWEITDEEIRLASKALQKESRNRLESYKDLSKYIAYERGLSRHIPLGWPALGRATSHFGRRLSPFHGRSQFHSGIDLANKKGTPVRATADGVVRLANWEGGYGRLISINHGYGYATYYGHNSVILVKRGESVRRGQIIAYMGSTGSATGSHVHYEIWKNRKAVNPWRYLVAKSADDVRFSRRRR